MTRSFFGLAVAAGLVVAGFYAFRAWDRDPDVPAGPPSFEGDSDRLERTVFVPTLDTPVPAGKSAVWCASFQLAWDKLKADIVKGPVEVTNAKEVCDRLNSARPVADDLPAEGFYAAAGFEGDGIRETIRTEMARKFPNAPPPELPDLGGGVHTYTYLEAEVRFERPYVVNSKEFRFRDSEGKGRPVVSFGIADDAEWRVRSKLEDQAGLLFADEGKDRYQFTAFAVDLDRNSRPNQVVLARVDRKGTLAETLANVERRIRTFVAKPDQDLGPALSSSHSLLAPNMRWKVRHQFRELLGPGRVLKLDGEAFPVAAAEQTTSFRLDSRGAGVESSAHLAAKKSATPRRLHFDHPFLLYLKKRGAGRPFFVMWVENAELLCGT